MDRAGFTWIYMAGGGSKLTLGQGQSDECISSHPTAAGRCTWLHYGTEGLRPSTLKTPSEHTQLIIAACCAMLQHGR